MPPPPGGGWPEYISLALIPFSIGQVVVEPEFHVFVLEVGVALVSKGRRQKKVVLLGGGGCCGGDYTILS